MGRPTKKPTTILGVVSLTFANRDGLVLSSGEPRSSELV